ncbi:MAG: DUF4364 family protein [Clostridia bacterium]|nr:DUF4364 family protein [Clostridia bacterium]
MKKKKMIWDKTDLKVFVLCLLDEMQHPMTYNAIVDTVMDCGCVEGFDFAECFSELRDLGHVIWDELDGVSYYMISASGSMVARELRGSLDKELLKTAGIAAARHLQLAKMGVMLHATVKENPDGRFTVSFRIDNGGHGALLDLSATVATREEADAIRNHCENMPAEKVYRAIRAVISGEIDYFM